MTSLGERLVLLLAACLLAGLGAAAALHRHHVHERSAAAGPAAPATEWFDAVAASRGIAGDAERTTCGLILTARSLGVSEPVLPCHAKVVVRLGDRTFLTEVIDNRLKAGGHQFEMTERLAEEMGLDGTQRIEWRFAAR
jgi:hypothetical protein